VPLAFSTLLATFDAVKEYRLFVFRCVLWLDDTPKVSEDVNRKLPTGKTMVQLLTLYTDPERHNAQRYRRTNRRTYGQTTL